MIAFMTFVGKGLWSVASGVLGNIATAGIAWGLDSIFGLQLGASGQQQNLAKALDEINGDFNTIENQLQQISADLVKLAKQINTRYHATIDSVLLTAVIPGQAAIGAAAGTLTQLMQTIAANVAHDIFPEKGTAEQQAQAILADTTGIQAQLNQVSAALLPLPGGPVGANGLLENWTTQAINLVLNNDVPIKEAYHLLEQYFLQYLQVIYQGQALITNASVFQETRDAYHSTRDKQKAATAGAQAGLHYLQTDAAPELAHLSQFFVQCAHRLLLSQYMRINPDITSGTNFMPAPSEADAQYVMARVSLLYLLVNSPGNSNPSAKSPLVDPGVVVISYNRPSQISGTSGPQLTPPGAYKASGGKTFALTYGYGADWFKVCDIVNVKGAPTLTPMQSSTIAIVDYQWPTPVPQPASPPAPLGGSGVFAQMVSQYYDATTLDVATAPSANTVVMAFGLDQTSIYENLFFPALTWQISCMITEGAKTFKYKLTPTGFQCDPQTKKNDPYPYAFWGSCSTPFGSTGVMNWTFSVTGAYKLKSKDVAPAFILQLIGRLNTSGSSSAVADDLYLGGATTFQYTATDKDPFYIGTPPLIPASAQYQVIDYATGSGLSMILFRGGGSITLGSSPTVWGGPNQAQQAFAVQTFPLSLQFNVQCAGQHQTDGKPYGVNNILTVTGTTKVDPSTFIAWPQPSIPS